MIHIHIKGLKEDYINLLRDSLKALRRKDTALLKEISNHVIHDASIYQDQDSVSLAVAIYALSKIVEREKSADPRIEDIMKNSISFISRDDLGGFRKNIHRLFRVISEKDRKMELYIDEVFMQARIKKGGSIYAHGLSAGKVANILGISQWELMSYIGKTRIKDTAMPKVSVEQRLNNAKLLFGVKQ